MSVYRRKERRNQWWVHVEFRHPDGRTETVRRRSPVQTRRGAEEQERQLRQAIAAGTYGRRTTPAFKDFAVEFMEGYAEQNNKRSEIETKRSHLKHHLVPFFGSRRLDEIGSREIEKYKADKQRQPRPGGIGYEPKTINNHLVTLKKMLNTALEWEYVEKVPKVKNLRVPPQGFDFLSFDEARELCGHAETEWTAMITVALHTGLRIGELRALRWNDVDFDRKDLTVERTLYRKDHFGSPKGNLQRRVDLNETALKALKRHRHLKGELVFCQPDGAPLTEKQCEYHLRKACVRAGLRKVTWHVLRHTFASHLVMRGVSMRIVQELLGHTDIKVTMRYAHLSPEAKRSAVNVLAAPAAP